jgi:ATP-dependent RNA helicase RhlE
MLIDPVEVSVAPPATTAERVQQRVFMVQRADKQALLTHLLDSNTAMDKVLVFSRTKHGADRVAKRLVKSRISAHAIHGGKSQGQRVRALEQFKRGETRVLVASDIAARGLDIDDVTHVINFDLPNEPETYVHRIGRTARAGASGDAMSFCSEEEREFLRDIERVARVEIPIDSDHPYVASFGKMSTQAPRQHAPKKQASARPGGRGRGPAKPDDGQTPRRPNRRRRRKPPA